MSADLLDSGKIRDLGLFDVNCRLGPADFTVSGAPATAAALLAEMDRLGIAEALVYHANAAGYSPASGNPDLVKEICGNSRLSGCWVLMPRFRTGKIFPFSVRAMRCGTVYASLPERNTRLTKER